MARKMKSKEDTGGEDKRRDENQVSARISSYLPEEILYHDPVRFGTEKFFGMPVSMTYSADKSGIHLQSKLPSQKAISRFSQRKNKNPLQTRVTVKQLKRLIEQHKMSINANRPNASGTTPLQFDILQRAMTVVDISSLDTRTPCAADPDYLIDATEEGGALLAMPTAFRPRKDLVDCVLTSGGAHVAKLPRRKYSTKFRPKTFAIARLTIGKFVVEQLPDALSRNIVKVFFAKELICYELTVDYPTKTCARPNRYSIVIAFHFDDIVGMNFTDHAVYIRLRRPPQQPFSSMLRSGCDDSGDRFRDDTSDMTFGQRDAVLVHKIELTHKQGALWQHWMLDYDVLRFEPLMMTQQALMNLTPSHEPDAIMPELSREDAPSPPHHQGDLLFVEPPGDAAASNALTTRFDHEEERQEQQEQQQQQQEQEQEQEQREHEYLPPNEMLPASQFHHRLTEQQPMIPHSTADLAMASRGRTDEQELLAYQSFDFGFDQVSLLSPDNGFDYGDSNQFATASHSPFYRSLQEDGLDIALL